MKCDVFKMQSAGSEEGAFSAEFFVSDCFHRFIVSAVFVNAKLPKDFGISDTIKGYKHTLFTQIVKAATVMIRDLQELVSVSVYR